MRYSLTDSAASVNRALAATSGIDTFRRAPNTTAVPTSHPTTIATSPISYSVTTTTAYQTTVASTAARAPAARPPMTPETPSNGAAVLVPVAPSEAGATRAAPPAGVPVGARSCA